MTRCPTTVMSGRFFRTDASPATGSTRRPVKPGLRLDVREAALVRGDSGDPGISLLIDRIAPVLHQFVVDHARREEYRVGEALMRRNTRPGTAGEGVLKRLA